MDEKVSIHAIPLLEVVQVLNYLWEDERRDYEANPREDHIFVSLKRVFDWIDDHELALRKVGKEEQVSVSVEELNGLRWYKTQYRSFSQEIYWLLELFKYHIRYDDFLLSRIAKLETLLKQGN